MIPKVHNYESSKVSAARTRFETEEMLEKKFGVKKTIWKRDDPQGTYFAFQYTLKDNDKPLTYKIQVPFIEKMEYATKGNRFSKRISVYDEVRSYRFFYHILNAMMLNNEIGMNFEQIMASYLVVGTLPDGTPQNVLDKVTEITYSKDRPALELK